ncbi:hypothetical protein ECANGB1_380 [Enterospora canceri]|uniref:Uncharacterized protein n=1 Tax=Enterospora canceri TaxID=1081671 RepID=A0A1Y1S808_9MICR|nr:hypothetical protein ECANGB1_380 [Enterospora canceri]
MIFTTVVISALNIVMNVYEADSTGTCNIYFKVNEYETVNSRNIGTVTLCGRHISGGIPCLVREFVNIKTNKDYICDMNQNMIYDKHHYWLVVDKTGDKSPEIRFRG